MSGYPNPWPANQPLDPFAQVIGEPIVQAVAQIGFEGDLGEALIPSSSNPLPVAVVSGGGGGSTTSTSPAQTSVGNTSSSILASNSARKEAVVVNTGTTVIYLGLGQVPTATAYHVALSPCAIANDGTGGTYISDLWKGAINAISGTSGTVCVTELT
jgi:hypothetical protein